MPGLTPDDLARWSRTRYTGDQLDAATARPAHGRDRVLWADLALQRIAITTKAAAALEERLEVVAAYDSGACPTCEDADARAFLAKLERIADETP